MRRESITRGFKGRDAEGLVEIRVGEIEEAFRGEAKRAESFLTFGVLSWNRDDGSWLNEVEDVSDEFGREKIEVTGSRRRTRRGGRRIGERVVVEVGREATRVHRYSQLYPTAVS